MTIGELIDADHIIVGLRVVDKAQLLQELARRASVALSLDQHAILGALQAREALGSTGLGKGFALPHARLSELPCTFTLFVRLARPIDFAAIDGLPVDLAILLLTSATAGNQHLATLAALSRPLRNAAFMQRLRRASEQRPSMSCLPTLTCSMGDEPARKPSGSTTREPVSSEALYEFKIDTNGDALADIAYRVRFSPSEDGSQAATLCRAKGA